MCIKLIAKAEFFLNLLHSLAAVLATSTKIDTFFMVLFMQSDCRHKEPTTGITGK